MRIVHFGTYSVEEGYPRNAVVKSALESAGATVIECRREAWGGSAERVRDATNLAAGAYRFFRVLTAWFLLVIDYLFRTPRHDLIVVGYPGFLDVFLARFLGFIRRKPVVLDAFLSVYESLVEDRKLVRPNGFQATFLKKLDKYSCLAANAVLLDTNAHIRYYDSEIGVAGERFVRVFVGAVEEHFHPPESPPRENVGEVLFFGSFLPLHGVDVIVRAASLLKNDPEIKFTMIGDGPEWERCEALARETGARIDFERRWISYPELADHISRSEICLGIFSPESKAGRVIPCKVYNIMAMGKPLITGDSEAASEALIHGENAFLVTPGDPEELAAAVSKLHRDPAPRASIGWGGLSTFRERFSRRSIGQELLEELRKRFRLEN